MLQKNVASQRAFFCLVNATSGAAFPGAAITQKLALDSGAQGNPTGSVTEIGGGQYRFDPSQADTNGNFVSYFFTATNAVPVCMNFITISATQVTGVPQVDVATWRATQPNPLISGRVDANAQATASALTFNLTGNVSGSVGSVTSATLVGTNADKTGYSLTQSFPSNFATLSIDGSGNVKVQTGIKKNTALANFEFLMTDSTNHAPATNAGSVSVQRSIDNGAFGSGTISSATIIGFGLYSVNLGAGDLNGGVITLRATATSCDDVDITVIPDP